VTAIRKLRSADPSPAVVRQLMTFLDDERPLIRYADDALVSMQSPTVESQFSNGVMVSMKVLVGGVAVPFEVTDAGSEAALALASFGPAALPAIRQALRSRSLATRCRALVALYNIEGADQTVLDLRAAVEHDTDFILFQQYLNGKPGDQSSPHAAAHLIARLRLYGVKVLDGGCDCLGSAMSKGSCVHSDTLDMAAERLVAGAKPSDAEILLRLGDARDNCHRVGRAQALWTMDSQLGALPVEQLLPWVGRSRTAEGLLKERGADAVPSLIAIVQDSRRLDAVLGAANVLGEIKDRRAVGPIIDAFQRVKAGELENVRGDYYVFAFSYALERLTARQLKSPEEWQRWWNAEKEAGRSQ
jgi:hypothetical protein